MVENVIKALEAVLLPKLAQIEYKIDAVNQKLDNLRELTDVRFKALEDKLELDRRLSVVEEKQKHPN